MERNGEARHPFPHFRSMIYSSLLLLHSMDHHSSLGHMEKRRGSTRRLVAITILTLSLCPPLKGNPWTGVLIRVQMPKSKEALLRVRFFPLFTVSGGMKLHNQAGVHLRGHVFFPLSSSSASSIKSPVGFPFFCGPPWTPSIK